MDGSEWFAPEIGKAVAAGYMNGYPDGSFRPQANIARQEAAVVLARIAGLKDSGGSGSPGGRGGSDDDKPSHVKVKSIQVTPQTMLLQVGRTGSIKVTVTPADASNKKVIWTSSDPGIATVDGSGKVTAVSPGVAVITAASAENTKIKASCIVTVTEYNVISNILQVTIEAR